MKILNEKWDLVKEALESINVASQAQVAACDLINPGGNFMVKV